VALAVIRLQLPSSRSRVGPVPIQTSSVASSHGSRRSCDAVVHLHTCAWSGCSPWRGSAFLTSKRRFARVSVVAIATWR